jgi:hypothetical protein
MSRRNEYDSVKNKEEFKLTIDGKDFDYRDPRQTNTATYYSKGNKEESNPNAYNMTNPLYDYSYGQVRDAAKAVGIKNVDEKKEVDSILNYIQNPKTEEEKPQETIDQKPTVKDAKPGPAIDLRQDTAEAKQIVENYNAGLLSGDGLSNNSIQRFAGIGSDNKAAGFLGDYSLKLRDGMKNVGMATRGPASGSTTVQPEASSAPVPQTNETSDEFTEQFKNGIKSNLVKV